MLDTLHMLTGAMFVCQAVHIHLLGCNLFYLVGRADDDSMSLLHVW
jgi:hypothetical protein